MPAGTPLTPGRYTSRQAFALGAVGGPMLVAAAYLLLLAVQPSWVPSWMFAFPLAVPFMLAVPAFLSGRRRDAGWMLAGAVVGVAVMVGLVLGMIVLLAYGLSAPMPER